MRGSLRLHLFSALVLLPVIVAAVMTIVAMRLFRQDKELYVFDLSSQSVELVARNLATTLESLRLRAVLGAGAGSRPAASQAASPQSSPLLAVSPASGSELPEDVTRYRVDNISTGGQPRLRVFARHGDGGVAMEVRPETLLDLRGYEGPTELSVVNDLGRVLVHRDLRQVVERRSAAALVQRLQLFAPGASRLGTRVVDVHGVATLVAYARVSGHLAVIQSISRKDVFAAADPLITSAALASCGVVIIAVLVALLMGRTIARPLRLAAQQAEAIGRGEFGVATEARTSGEVARLLDSLNAMSASLKKRDVELRQMQHQLLQAERLNSASRMIGSIVKELSSPLEACFNLANETLLQLPERSELRDVQQRILAEANRGSNILQNLSRVSTRDDARARATELDMLVADVLMSSGPVFERRQLALETDLTTPVGQVVVGPDQLRNALMDIFLFVAEQARPRAPVQVALARRDGDVVINIEWRGTPIGEAQREQLLRPFGGDGSGGGGERSKGALLLAVASSVVEEQGGRLVLEALADGNRLSVLIPADANSARREHRSAR